MPDTQSIETPIPDTHVEYLERISELEEENARLRHLERTIQHNLKLFEALVSSVADGLTLARADGTIIRVLRGLLGYPANSLNGMAVENVVFEEDQNLIRESFDQIRAGLKRKVTHELRLIKADGSVLWVEMTLTDMLDNPSVMAVVSVIHDLSWRRHDDLMAPQLQALSDHTAVVFFATGLEGSIEAWHASTAQVFGYAPREVVGQHVSMLLPPGTEEQDRSMRSAVIQTGQPSERIPMMLRRRNGMHLTVHLTLAPLVCGDAVRGVGYLVEPLAKPAVFDGVL